MMVATSVVVVMAMTMIFFHFKCPEVKKCKLHI